MRGSYNPLEEEWNKQRRLGQRDGREKALLLFGLWLLIAGVYAFFGGDFYKTFFWLSLGSAVAEAILYIRSRSK